MVKKTLLSIVGSACSILSIAGIILSNALSEVLIFVVAAMSGLFTLAVSRQK